MRLKIYDHFFAGLTADAHEGKSVERIDFLKPYANADPLPGLMRTSSFLRREATSHYRKHLEAMQHAFQHRVLWFDIAKSRERLNSVIDSWEIGEEEAEKKIVEAIEVLECQNEVAQLKQQRADEILRVL